MNENQRKSTKIDIDTLSIPGAFLVHLWYKTFLRQDWARGGAKFSSNRHIPQAIYTFHKVYSIRYNTIQCNNERSSCAFLVRQGRLRQGRLRQGRLRHGSKWMKINEHQWNQCTSMEINENQFWIHLELTHSWVVFLILKWQRLPTCGSIPSRRRSTRLVVRRRRRRCHGSSATSDSVVGRRS